jgi:hypothetical protein
MAGVTLWQQIAVPQRNPLGAARPFHPLGERGVRRWVRLIATLSAGQRKSSELVLSALVRRVCELLVFSIPHGSSDLVPHEAAVTDRRDS